MSNIIKNIKGRFKQSRQGAVGSSKSKSKSESTRIQIGWMHFCTKKREYAQVKGKGAGTPTVYISRKANFSDVLEKSKECVLPDGISKKGPIKNMECKLCTLQKYKPSFINPEDFVVDAFCQKGAKLKIYLCTKVVEQGCH